MNMSLSKMTGTEKMYLGADLVGNLLESLPHRLDRTSGLKDDSSAGARLELELGLGAPVDVADDVVDGLLELLARSELVGREGDALRVLAGDVHRGESRATADGQSSRGTIGSGIAVDTVGGDGSRLLAPGGRDRSLGTGLAGAESWEGLLRGRVQGRLLRGRSVFHLLLAGGLLAQGRRLRLG
jgi:hypothetical protein